MKQQCGFSGAVRAEQCERPAPGQTERDRIQCSVAAGIAETEILDLNCPAVRKGVATILNSEVFDGFFIGDLFHIFHHYPKSPGIAFPCNQVLSTYPLSAIHYLLSYNVISKKLQSQRRTNHDQPFHPIPGIHSPSAALGKLSTVASGDHSLKHSLRTSHAVQEQCTPERFRGLSPFCSPIVSQIPAHQENAGLSPIPVRADRCSGM